MSAGRLALALSLVLATGAARADVLLDDDGIALRNPHASAHGDLIVVERTLFANTTCATAQYSDVLVLDARSGCGQTTQRLITRDGASSEGCVSEDGTRIAWKTIVGSNSRITVANPDGTNLDVVYDQAGTVSSLELSPDGSFLAFKLTGGAAGSGGRIDRIKVSTHALTVCDSMPIAQDIELNRRRCVTNGGGVVYTKRMTALAHDVFAFATGITRLTNTPEDERMASFSVAQNKLAFRRTSTSNVQNVFVGAANGFGGFSAVTANTSPNTVMFDVVISSFGDHVSFVSNGNFTSLNPDDSFEAYTTGPVTQWGAHLVSGSGTEVEQAEAIDRGSLLEAEVFVETGDAGGIPPCLADSFNGDRVAVVSALPVTVTTRTDFVSLRDIPGYETFTNDAVGLDCAELPLGSGHYECSFALMNPTASARTFFAWPDWPFASTAPHVFTVGADSDAKVTLSINASSFQHGTATIHLVSPDTGLPDVKTVADSF